VLIIAFYGLLIKVGDLKRGALGTDSHASLNSSVCSALVIVASANKNVTPSGI
jgi:hypothetical protein